MGKKIQVFAVSQFCCWIAIVFFIMGTTFLAFMAAKVTLATRQHSLYYWDHAFIYGYYINTAGVCAQHACVP